MMNSLDGLEQWQNNGGEMNKGKQFADWLQRMDWEGGVAELVQHGDYDSGDHKLDSMLDELDSLLLNINSRINELVKEHKEELHEG